MKDNKISKYTCVGLISILVFVIYSDRQKKYFLDKDMFYEWIQFNTNGILVIVGAFCTIIAVLLTIKYTQEQENKRCIHKSNKIKIILLNDLILVLRYYEYLVLKGLKRKIDIYLMNEKIEFDGFEHLEFKKVFKLKESFIDNTYELLMNSNEIDNKIIEEIILFYNQNLGVEDLIQKESNKKKIQKIYIDANIGANICTTFFSENITQLYKKIHKLEKESLLGGNQYFEDKFDVLDEIIDNYNKLVIENKKYSKIHHNERIKNIIIFLKDDFAKKDL